MKSDMSQIIIYCQLKEKQQVNKAKTKSKQKRYIKVQTS